MAAIPSTMFIQLPFQTASRWYYLILPNPANLMAARVLEHLFGLC
jgi:hypothetical protein